MSAPSEPKKEVLAAKPDAMAAMAPAHVTRPIDPDKKTTVETEAGPADNTATPNVAVGLPYYRENLSGQVLDHTLYVKPRPELEYRFMTNKDAFGGAKTRAKGFRDDRESERLDGPPLTESVKVDGMTLGSRPRALTEMHDARLLQRMQGLSKKKGGTKEAMQEEARKLGLPSETIIGSERNVVETV